MNLKEPFLEKTRREFAKDVITYNLPITLSEFENLMGITEDIDDFPPEYCPDSESWLSMTYPEADFEKSHREADKALAWLEKYLQTSDLP